jgi:hypothetical protein
VTKEPDHRGEHEISRNTIARGMPGVSGVTVVTNARVYYHYTRGCGRTRRPAFPAPSEGRAGNSWHHSDVSRRENAKLYLHRRPCLVRNCARGAGTHNHRTLCCAKVVQQHSSTMGRGVWVPACAGTTLRNCTLTINPHSSSPAKAGDPVFQRRQ